MISKIRTLDLPMNDLSFWSLLLPACALLLLFAILMARGFGVIKLEWLNAKWIRELKEAQRVAEDPSQAEALQAIIKHCTALNSKWILRESDLNILENSYGLVKEIASACHPNSSAPVEEARIRGVLQAFMELKNRLLVLTTWKGVHAMTQFRLQHVLFLSRAWKIKEEWKEWKIAKVLRRYRLYPLLRWAFFIVRCTDLAFWTIKMTTYIIYDIVLKVFLVRWYLTIGELAMQVYRDREDDPEIRPQDLLDDFDSMPEPESPTSADLSEEVKKISETSKKEILFHTLSVEWEQAKEIYIRLIEDIARSHHPQAKQPIYQAKLYDLMMGGVRFSEKIAAIQTYPFLNKVLDLKISHVLMVKDTADFLRSSQVLAWVRKYKLTYIYKYALLLFKVAKRGNPALLFKDFAITLVGEGVKRWLYLYLHDKITVEANFIYQGGKKKLSP